MVKDLLPVGLRGIVVAGLLSALDGLAGRGVQCLFDALHRDLYEKWRPGATPAPDRPHRAASPRASWWPSRWRGFPSSRAHNSLYEYLQSIQGYLAPPIFVVFFLGVFFKRLNAKGCLWAMVVGFVLGVFRMLVDTPVTLQIGSLPGIRATPQQPGKFLWIINNIYFQYFSILITIVSAVTMVAVSLATAPPSEAQIKSLTFGTATEEDKRKTRASWSWQEVLASWLCWRRFGGVFVFPGIVLAIASHTAR